MSKIMKVGLIGYRGMVGSVLLARMREEGDFANIDPIFFSTTDRGKSPPPVGSDTPLVQDPFNLKLLADCDVLISCQGGDYTRKIYPELKGKWRGYWIDASSLLRMQNDVIIPLDPVNLSQIQQGIDKGIKTFAGANCTVGLLLLSLHGLFKENLVDWISTMTYQAVSGAGASQMKELTSQVNFLNENTPYLKTSNALALEEKIGLSILDDSFPKQELLHPLAYNLLPWIDNPMENGQSREEWKGFAEANKILSLPKKIPIDGTCVRIPTLRCHCQAITIKLTKNTPLNELEKIIGTANDWTFVVPNTREDTLKYLTPLAVSRTLSIPIGRLRKMNLGEKYLNAFSVGDQLLWGAAEPLRRVLNIIKNH